MRYFFTEKQRLISHGLKITSKLMPSFSYEEKDLKSEEAKVMNQLKKLFLKRIDDDAARMKVELDDFRRLLEKGFNLMVFYCENTRYYRNFIIASLVAIGRYYNLQQKEFDIYIENLQKK